jgi:hypothetical protein
LLLFELTHDIRIVLPLMAATGLSALLVERWQGYRDRGLLGADPLEERRRLQLAALPVIEAFGADVPLVLPASTPAVEAVARLIEVHGHCLIAAKDERAVALVTLQDLQRGLSAGIARDEAVSVNDCRRSELVWLPLTARLDRLEDQLSPNGLRQVPVFAVEEGVGGYLPHGLPADGLPIAALRGLASRDGLALALARQLSA